MQLVSERIEMVFLIQSQIHEGTFAYCLRERQGKGEGQSGRDEGEREAHGDLIPRRWWEGVEASPSLLVVSWGSCQSTVLQRMP